MSIRTSRSSRRRPVHRQVLSTGPKWRRVSLVPSGTSRPAGTATSSLSSLDYPEGANSQSAAATGHSAPGPGSTVWRSPFSATFAVARRRGAPALGPTHLRAGKEVLLDGVRDARRDDMLVFGVDGDRGLEWVGDEERLDQRPRHLARGREVTLHSRAENHEVVVLERHGGERARRRVAVVRTHTDVVAHSGVRD